MAIMKLSNVPELTEFAGTEKIYVNDNGKTKQIACDKVVTAGGGGSGPFIIDSTADDYSSSDHTYGNKIRDAFLSGRVIYYYDGNTYYIPSQFTIGEGDNYLHINIRIIERGGSGNISTSSNFGYNFEADLL